MAGRKTLLFTLVSVVATLALSACDMSSYSRGVPGDGSGGDGQGGSAGEKTRGRFVKVEPPSPNPDKNCRSGARFDPRIQVGQKFKGELYSTLKIPSLSQSMETQFDATVLTAAPDLQRLKFDVQVEAAKNGQAQSMVGSLIQRWTITRSENGEQSKSEVENPNDETSRFFRELTIVNCSVQSDGKENAVTDHGTYFLADGARAQATRLTSQHVGVISCELPGRGRVEVGKGSSTTVSIESTETVSYGTDSSCGEETVFLWSQIKNEAGQVVNEFRMETLSSPVFRRERQPMPQPPTSATPQPRGSF